MMPKALITSDLHLNHYKDFGISFLNTLPDADILVVAGDLCSGVYCIEMLLTEVCNRYDDVIYVLGNHEYYQHDWQTIDNLIRELSSKLNNLHWLENSKAKVQGINFVGSTLWFPNNYITSTHKQFYHDYDAITDFEPEVYKRYEESVKFLTYNINPGDVVITHNSPSFSSVSPRFYNSLINCYWHNDLDDLIRSTKPSIWIHGHTHDPVDYMLDNTRIICNPLGYPREANNFNYLILDLK